MSISYSREGSHSDCRWTCGCAGKTVRSVENKCHTWALLRWWFTNRHYIKCTYLYLYLKCQHKYISNNLWECNGFLLAKKPSHRLPCEVAVLISSAVGSNQHHLSTHSMSWMVDLSYFHPWPIYTDHSLSTNLVKIDGRVINQQSPSLTINGLDAG